MAPLRHSASRSFTCPSQSDVFTCVCKTHTWSSMRRIRRVYICLGPEDTFDTLAGANVPRQAVALCHVISMIRSIRDCLLNSRSFKYFSPCLTVHAYCSCGEACNASLLALDTCQDHIHISLAASIVLCIISSADHRRCTAEADHTPSGATHLRSVFSSRSRTYTAKWYSD